MKLTWILAAVAVFALAVCGGEGGSGGGGGAGGSGLTGIEPCVAAQEYINGEPCLSDANVPTDQYTLQLDVCETIDLQCANCIKNKKHLANCVLVDDCGSFGCGQVRMR